MSSLIAASGTTTLDFTIRNLSNSPGILPIKLGTAKGTHQYWNLINQIDLGLIEKEIVIIAEHLNVFKHTEGSTEAQISNLNEAMEKVKDKLVSIIPEHRHKTKRGAANFLGGIIKAITGNLDNDDATRYEAAITHLNENQKSLKHLVSESISLTQNAIEEFHKSINSITENQRNLRILLDNVPVLRTMVIDVRIKLIVLTAYNHMIYIINSLNDILNNIINSLTFAKKQIYHPSILSPDQLYRELLDIQNYISYLPMKLTYQNIYKLESVIKVKAYVKEKVITYVLLVPFVGKEIFTYYKMLPLPIQITNSTFKFLDPINTYLAISKDKYFTSNTLCYEYDIQQFICEITIENPIDDHSPCEIQILKYTKKYEGCQWKTTSIDIMVKHVTTDQWIVVTNQKRKVQKLSELGEEIEELDGTNLVHIPPGCTLKIGKMILKPYVTTKPIIVPKLPQLPFLQLDSTNYSHLPYNLTLKESSFHNLTQIKVKLEQTKRDVEALQNTPLHEQPASIWDGALLIALVLILVCASYKSLRKWRASRTQEATRPDDEPPPVHPLV